MVKRPEPESMPRTSSVMADEQYETWETIWALLLKEAARRAAATWSDSPLFGQYTAAIVLAKASWETFQNEFIESRDLSEEIKGRQLTKAIPMICKELNVKEFSFSQGTLWEALLSVGRLRNAIVHHDAKPRAPGESPNGLIASLSRHGVIDCSNLGLSWERLLVTAQTAGWSCTVVGNAILELEEIPNRRRRSFASVQERVWEALELLPSTP